ncbi:MAG: thioesterase family protein [Acidimicrobiia bacterium]|nr:thioesterase family protein [Acidimicrobiia bacterium]
MDLARVGLRGRHGALVTLAAVTAAGEPPAVRPEDLAVTGGITAVFEPDGDLFVPSEIARGPWDPDAQHGGAPAALLARAVERFEPGPASFVARITIELLRPVPLTPLEVRTRMLRPGRRVQLVEAALHAGGVEVARAAGLRIREEDLDLPPGAHDPDRPALAGPATGEPAAHERFPGAMFPNAVEVVFVAGEFWEPGPSSAWFRLRIPIVAGEEPSPLMRVAAAADFPNGISAPLSWTDGWLYINPELTIHLHRRPEGEWVGLDATTWVEPNGVGLAEAVLHDGHGRIGRSSQSLLVGRLDGG